MTASSSPIHTTSPATAARLRFPWSLFPDSTYRRTLLIFSQVFVPDPASVGQHLYDVAREMVRRGFRVRVLTARHGYDDPSKVYPAKEILDGIEIIRLPFASFGKSTFWTRALGTASFQIQAMLRGVFTGNLAGVFFSTSPPLIGFAATVIRMFRTIPLVYWAMDLNPDQLIAMRIVTRDAASAAFLESANRMILRNASLVIALDRFMAARLRARAKLDDKLVVIPPWPHETFVDPIAHEENPFRARHNLAGKFVVMYSGNHSPSNPLNTLLHAAGHLRDDSNIVFMFVGGGVSKRTVVEYVKQNNLTNVICLPYQSLEELRYSLSAADVHAVTLGNRMVGIIHPCKVYGAMAVGRPVLYIGPKPSHVGDLIAARAFGMHVPHGEVEAAVNAILTLRDTPIAQREAMGQLGQRVLASSLSQETLCGRLCDGLQLAIR